MASFGNDPTTKYYYFIDIDLASSKIVGWDSDTRGHVDSGVLANGLYRVFLTKGQYNKLVRQLNASGGG